MKNNYDVSNTIQSKTKKATHGLKAVLLCIGLMLAVLNSTASVVGSYVVYTSPGTYTFTVPAGVYSVNVYIWSAGGGGAGGNSSISGGGGAGGSYLTQSVNVDPLTTYTVIVGAGGEGGSVNNDGIAGDSSSFGNSLTGIVSVSGGGEGFANGSGGNPTTGGITYYGGSGGNATTGWGGGGGGGAGSEGNGAAPSLSYNGGMGAAGGGVPGGGSGAGGDGGYGGENEVYNAYGVPGNSIAGGGGGGYGHGTIADPSPGGNGADGEVIVAWTCPSYDVLSSTTATAICGASGTSTVTISASSLNLATYMVTYNTTNPDTYGNTASMYYNGGSFSFTSITLSATSTLTVTNIAYGTSPDNCSSSISQNNSATITVSNPAPVIISSPIPCSGTNLLSSTPYDGYLWSDNETTSSIVVSAGGTYSVTVTDDNGCSNTGSLSVAQPTAVVTASCGSTPASCFGGNDGSVSVIAGGGAFGYSYLWSSGNTTSSVSNLYTGSYSVTVTDGNACTATGSTFISQPPPSRNYVVTNTNDAGCGSLRNAILNTNANPGADTIFFDPSVTGTIGLASALPEILDTLTITGPGASLLTISGGDSLQVFVIGDYSNLTINIAVNISGLKIVHGFASAQSLGGGGLLISNNQYNQYENVTITNCIFIYDGAVNTGGAISDNADRGYMNVSNCTFTGNSASAGGGGIFLRGSATNNLTNCTFLYNSASDGGGIKVGSGVCMMAYCTFTNNTATDGSGGEGGAILNDAQSVVSNCTFTNNSAINDVCEGGAIYNSRIAVITNCTLNNNTVTGAGSAGGAIYNGMSITVTNSTLTNNSASGDASEGGGVGEEGQSRATVLYSNNIIAGNINGDFYYENNGTPNFQHNYNFIGNGAGSGANGSGSAFANGDGNNDTVGTSLNPINPLLDTLGNYGGAVQTMALLPGSPCINRGSCNHSVDSTDARGVSRPQGAGCDIGAFEVSCPNVNPVISGNLYTCPSGSTALDAGTGFYSYNWSTGATTETITVSTQGTYSVSVNNLIGCSTNTASVNVINPHDYGRTYIVTNTNDAGCGSLRQALLNSNASPGADTIVFDPSVTGTIGLASALPEILDTLTITGPGADVLTISGGDSLQVFVIGDYNNLVINIAVTISGITVAHGYNASNSTTAGGGGALLISKSNLNKSENVTISNCVFTNNAAVYKGGAISDRSSKGSLTMTNCTISNNAASGGTGLGGGIYFIGNSINLANCTFLNNSAVSGGGINFAGGVTCIMTYCNFTNNIASGNHGEGGAFYAALNTASAVYCTFTNNSATGDNSAGGAIFSFANTNNLTNCTLTNNSVTGSASSGGGIYNTDATKMTLTNCTLTNNSSSGDNSLGGGIFENSSSSVYSNNIIAGNVNGDFYFNGGSPFLHSYNFVGNGDGSGNFGSGSTFKNGDANHDTVGTTANPINALLDTLGNYGGPVQTIALLPGSPCINRGSCVSATDARDMSRPQGAGCDIGAFEVACPDLQVAPSISGNVPFCKGGSATLDAGAGFYDYSWSTGATTESITVSTGGTYSVTVNSSIGCSNDTSSVTVVQNQPYISTAVSDTFKLAGSSSFTVPAGVMSLTVQLWGAGGGGSGSDIGTSGGGGGGGSFTNVVVPVNPLNNYSIVVGAGGIGGSGGNNGFNGDSSVFTLGNTALAFAAPGLGGTGINGAPLTTGITYNGGAGGSGFSAGGGASGGSGGGASGSSGSGSNGNNGNASNTLAIGGSGGNGGGGNGGDGGIPISLVGKNGLNPGGGGGGGGYTEDNGTHPGGNGADGQVVISYILPDVFDTACDSFIWLDSIYISSTTVTRTFSGGTINGCDSTVTLSITINHSDSSFATVTNCAYYVWNGDTLRTSGSYGFADNDEGVFNVLTDGGHHHRHSLRTVSRCDSTAILYLTINNSNTGDTRVTVCNSFTWYGVTYTSSGNAATHVFTNAGGCDSTVTLNLTVNSSSSSTTNQIACNSYTWIGTTYTVGGNYTYDAGINAAGCDSTANLNLTINYSSSSIATQTACNSYRWNGTTYTAGGNYSYDAGANAAGCDSTANLNLTINYSSSGDTTASACNNFTWYGTTYTASTNATKVLTNAGGCDSTVTLHLTITIPSAPIVTVSNNCGSSTLSTTATGSLHWSTGATTSSITVTTNSTYSVTSAVNGCVSAAGTNTAAPKAIPSAPLVSVSDNCGSATLSTTATGTLHWTSGATTSSITVTAAGTYSVTRTVNGCISEAGKGSALPLPVPPKPVTSVVNHCGHSILTTGSSGILHWSNGSTLKSITVTRGGNYTVTTTVGACVSQPGTAYANPGNPPAKPDTLKGNNSACKHTGPFTYSISAEPAANSYIWTLPYGMHAPKLNTSVPRISVTFSDTARTGKISVAGKNTCGIGPALSKTITINCREEEETAPDVPSTTLNLNAYPNPAHDLLNVDFTIENAGAYNVKMLDMTGRMLLNKVANAQQGSNHLEFDTGNFAPGMYILSFTSGEKNRQVRVVVE